MVIEIKEGDKIIAKIGSEEEAYWTQALKESEATLGRLKSAIKMEEAINEMLKVKVTLNELKGGEDGTNN